MSALAANIVAFARILRHAGMPLGSGQIVAAGHAMRASGISQRDDFRAALFASLVTHRSQMPLFDQAFDAFWRADGELNQQLAALLPQTVLPPETTPPPAARRLSEALHTASRRDDAGAFELWADATGSASEIEALRSKDFAQMSAVELAAAKRALAGMNWQVKPRPSRRRRPSPLGRIDARRTLRAMLRTQGEALTLQRASRRETVPPLVALIDISGSMSEYSRTILHFLHGLARDGARDGRRVTTFLFGTRLTNVTRALRHRDIDEALQIVSQQTPDWDGGTRIGEALYAFNKSWSRRVLGQGAHVLLLTDGLEREDPAQLSREARRLSQSARGVTWANPLLRYAAFEPKAQGIRALKPHVTRLAPIHNLDSVAALAGALSA
jgi:uncharacterized protein